MGLLWWAAVLSAALAVAGAWSAAGAASWRAYWPAPFMVAVTVIGARDLVSLLGEALTDLPDSALVLGIWAAAVVDDRPRRSSTPGSTRSGRTVSCSPLP